MYQFGYIIGYIFIQKSQLTVVYQNAPEIDKCFRFISSRNSKKAQNVAISWKKLKGDLYDPSLNIIHFDFEGILTAKKL